MPFDPVTVGTTFSAIRGVVAQFGDTPLKQLVIDLQNLLIDLQGRMLEQQNELLIANARIHDLERQLSQPSAAHVARGAATGGPLDLALGGNRRQRRTAPNWPRTGCWRVRAARAMISTTRSRKDSS